MMEVNTYAGNRLAIFIAFFIPVQILAVVVRLYARRLTARTRSLDDLLVVFSLLGQLVASGIAIGKSENQKFFV